MSQGIPTDFKDELLSKIDIVDVVSGYVQLKRNGKNFWGCCPFHMEKTPSFSVDTAKQFYYCFGCGKGGDVITFVKEMEHLTFIEALEFLADRAGMTVPKNATFKKDDKQEKLRKLHYEICQKTALFYYKQLKGNDRAKKYCESRGLSAETVIRFGLGYAPKNGELSAYLLNEGYSAESIINSGLAKKRDNGALNDFFFDRLMFPIMDVYGNVIAFGGRVLEKEQMPKYLNSSDSPMYNKKKHLYGLNIAKKKKETNRIILVEGYMDVVAVSSYGVGGAVASLGTSLTEEQCALIKRYTSQVYIAYDGDGAGRKAAVRAGRLFINHGIMPRIVVFKDGKDPDEFLKAYGVDAFENELVQAVLPYKFEIDYLEKDFDLTAENGRRDFAVFALKEINYLKDEIDKENMYQYLSEKTAYSVEVIKKQATGSGKDNDGYKSNRPERPKPQGEQVKPKAKTLREKGQMLALKMAMRGKRQEILDALKEDDFDKDAYKTCYKYIAEKEMSEEEVLARFQDDDAGLSTIIPVTFISDDEADKGDVEDCVNAIKNFDINEEILFNQQKLKENLSDEETDEILSIISNLKKKLLGN